MNTIVPNEPSGQAVEEVTDRPPRKKRMTKAEKASYYSLLTEDIRLNGHRQPLELARQYGLAEKKVCELLAEAYLNGDITAASLDHTVERLWNIKSYIQKTMGLSNKDLLRVEGDKNALLITPVK